MPCPEGQPLPPGRKVGRGLVVCCYDNLLSAVLEKHVATVSAANPDFTDKKKILEVLHVFIYFKNAAVLSSVSFMGGRNQNRAQEK